MLEATYIGPMAEGKPDCLIVLCHGIHADASQLSQLLEVWRDMLPTAAFTLANAPWRGRHHWLAPLLSKRREWFSIHDKSPAAYEAGVRSAAALLDGLIDSELARLTLPAHAYALAGYSQGAMMVLFAGLRRAVAPRAIVGIAGSLIAAEKLAGEIGNRAPVMLLHGADDPLVPSTASEQAARVLADNGVPVETLFRPGLAHDLDNIEIRESALFLRRVLFGTDDKALS
jgi:phospholipase/carboxylesterase